VDEKMISLTNLFIIILIIILVLFLIKYFYLSPAMCPKIYFEGKGFDIEDKLCIITGANDGFYKNKIINLNN
jgi:hypothetical protein